MFKQKLSTVIKAKSAELKKIDKDGKKAVVLEVKGTIVPEGVYVTVSKFINIKEGMHEFLVGKIKEFEGFVETFNDRDEKDLNTYFRVGFKPKTKGKEVIQYDKISTDVLDDGREFIKIDSWAELMDSGEENDREYVVFTYGGYAEDKKVYVDELSPTIIEATMIVLGQEEDRITLTSGGDYPKELVVYQDMVNVKGQPKIGQGYNFLLGMEKGKRVSVSSDESSDISWGSEAVVKKGGFEKDKIMILSVGLEKGYVLDGVANPNEDPLDSMMELLK